MTVYAATVPPKAAIAVRTWGVAEEWLVP
jgi:hypothetical protein